AVILGVLIRDQLVEHLDDLLAARTHPVERDVEDEVIAADVANEALRRVTLHDVAQQSGEHPDDAITLVVAVPVVELLEVVQIGVADREELIASDAVGDVALDLYRPGQTRGGMDADVTIRSPQDHAQPQHLLS